MGDELKIVAVAFESDPPIMGEVKNLLYSVLISYLDSYTGVAGMIVTLLESTPSSDGEGIPEGTTAESTEDDFVGAIQLTYSSLENWGVGSQIYINNGDLRLWFSISFTESDTSIFTPVTTTTTDFSVTSYGFSPNPINVGDSTNGTITITGGSPGAYTLVVLEDIAMGIDTAVATYTIYHFWAATSNSLT